MNPTVENIYKMCVPDSHYERIIEMINESKTEIYLTHKSGNRVKFYLKDEKLYADEEKDDSIFTQEVIKMSSIDQVKRDNSDFKNEMIKKIENDNPNMLQEDKEALADILYEANESIKKLIASGVQPNVAKQIIEAVLNDKDIIDGTGGNVEALADIIKQKEEMLSNNE